MTPTVGRIVHFHPAAGEVRAAIVAHVWNATLLNLTVCDSNGDTHGETSIALGGPGLPGTWSWPPKV